MTVKMEVFSGAPPCSGCTAALALADEYQNMGIPSLEVIRWVGREAIEKFTEYGLSCTPAVVINQNIRFEGICPSRTTLDIALKEAGL